jgi:predicted DNA-binding protein (UPF0251 family)/predicted Fe-Mo cluster-binding NifX family protein
MPRPQKGRRVCSHPRSRCFMPAEQALNEQVVLRLDELESIRLLDLVGMSQDATGEQMLIGRATVQRIYEDARRKIADALVNGKSILIEGGNIEYCDNTECLENQFIINKGENSNMKIAIPVMGTEIFGHFGHAPQFRLVTIENMVVQKTDIIEAPEHQHGVLPGFLFDLGVDTVIASTLGQGAIDRFNRLRVVIYSGLNGDVDEAIRKVLSGEVEPNAQACGHHHEGGHHE